MNRKILAPLAATAMLFVSLCVAGSGSARRKEISSTRQVVIDGNSFASDESPTDGSSRLEGELRRMGVRIPDGFSLREEPGSPHPAFEGRLRDSRPRFVEPVRLPVGMTAEHTLRMEGEGMPVDLVFGNMDATGPSIRHRLISSGWESVSAGSVAERTHVLHSAHGKEVAIVCLDEAEGTFLLFREVGR